MPRISRKLATAAAILGAGIGVFVILKLSGPVQQPVESRERVWRVDAQIAQPSLLSPTLTLYGRVETPELLRAAAPAARLLALGPDQGLGVVVSIYLVAAISFNGVGAPVF